MLRTTALLLMGAVPAGLVTWWLTGGESPGAGAGGGTLHVAPADRDGARTDATGALHARLDAFRSAQDISDPAELERALARGLTEPASTMRDVHIEALFKRLAALDVRRALRMAGSSDLDAMLVADVVAAWAESDPDAALQQLAGISSGHNRLTAAVAIADALGTDNNTLERIAAALPEHQRIEFQAEVVARHARHDPDGALRMALSMRDTAARNTVARHIGMTWAHDDPIGAYMQAATLPRELQSAYRDSVAVEWARLDAAGFLQFAETQPQLNDLHPGMTQAMAVDPERVLEVTANKPPLPFGDGFPANITVERTAFTALAQRDPQRMAAYLESLPFDDRREEFTVAFAQTYGRTRPAEALAWARSVEPPRPGLVATVIAQSALVDLDQAIRWMNEFEAPPGGNVLASPQYIAANIATFAAADPRRAEIASRLAEQTDDPHSALLLNRITSIWVQNDPAGALDWMLSSGSALDDALAANIARQLASRDAATAAAFTDRMPPELRNLWLGQVAGPYARQNPEAAAAWLLQFQGEPGYDNALRQVMQTTAQAHPQSAARMLASAPADIQQSSVSTIASSWARQDLAGAAAWASSLPDEQRSAAVNAVAMMWTARDPQAAQRWALGLPAGDTRDRALSGIVTRSAMDSFDIASERRFFEAFSSDTLRQTQAFAVARSVAPRDPDRAQALMDNWITEPGPRQMIEAAIEEARRR